MKELEQRACSYLGRDPILYMDMVELLRRGQGTVAAVREDGALVYVPASRAYLLAAENTQAGEALSVGLLKPGQVAVHDPENARLVGDILGYGQQLECRAAAYLEPLPPSAGDFVLDPLGEDQVERILEEFPGEFEREELRERLRAGVMRGLFEGGQLQGLAGLYPEGGLGMLSVKPPYMERGAAQALLSGVTAWCLEQGLAPFAHIPAEDLALQELYRQLGYTLSDTSLYWLGE